MKNHMLKPLPTMFTLELHLVVKCGRYTFVLSRHKWELTSTWFADSCVSLLFRLWMWPAWGPSARRCCARRPARCPQPSATSTRWRSLSCKGTRLQWKQMRMKTRRRTVPGLHRSTLHPPAWVFAGTPHVITALRSLPTWLTSESASPSLLVPSPNTSSRICSLTPATGWRFVIVNAKGYEMLHYMRTTQHSTLRTYHFLKIRSQHSQVDTGQFVLSICKSRKPGFPNGQAAFWVTSSHIQHQNFFYNVTANIIWWLVCISFSFRIVKQVFLHETPVIQS